MVAEDRTDWNLPKLAVQAVEAWPPSGLSWSRDHPGKGFFRIGTGVRRFLL
jgi:hypothetical protein